ncbi:SIMPL domain-containing protein, partial [Rhizobium hidalgonense]
MNTNSHQNSVLPWLTLGVVLALGFIIAALIIGQSAKQVASSRESITVKGTAEESVKADKALWSVTVSTSASSVAQALPELQKQVAQIKKELTTADLLPADQLQQYDWTTEPIYQRSEGYESQV